MRSRLLFLPHSLIHSLAPSRVQQLSLAGRVAASDWRASTVEALASINTATCVVLMVGVPGAGKSTITAAIECCSGQLASLLHTSELSVTRFVFDDLISVPIATRDVDRDVGDGHDESASFKAQRARVYEQVERHVIASVQQGHPHRQLVLVDDNMFYRSMRYHYAKMARTHGCAFVQLMVEVDEATAMERDAQRPDAQRVGGACIASMFERLQRPRPELFAWERESYTIINSERIQLDARDNDADRTMVLPCNPNERLDALEPVLRAIVSAWLAYTPPSTLNDTTIDAIRAADRERTQQSVQHQADIRARRVVSQVMAAVRSSRGSTAAQMRDAARVVAQVKLSALEDLRDTVSSTADSDMMESQMHELLNEFEIELHHRILSTLRSELSLRIGDS